MKMVRKGFTLAVDVETWLSIWWDESLKATTTICEILCVHVGPSALFEDHREISNLLNILMVRTCDLTDGETVIQVTRSPNHTDSPNLLHKWVRLPVWSNLSLSGGGQGLPWLVLGSILDISEGDLSTPCSHLLGQGATVLWSHVGFPSTTQCPSPGRVDHPSGRIGFLPICPGCWNGLKSSLDRCLQTHGVVIEGWGLKLLNTTGCQSVNLEGVLQQICRLFPWCTPAETQPSLNHWLFRGQCQPAGCPGFGSNSGESYAAAWSLPASRKRWWCQPHPIHIRRFPCRCSQADQFCDVVWRKLNGSLTGWAKGKLTHRSQQRQEALSLSHQ